MILPGRARLELCLQLPEPVLPERFRGERGERDAAVSFVRQLTRDPRENAAYLHHT